MGSTNLDFMGYPTCDKKVGYPPDRPYSHEAYAINQYRSEIENYIYSVDEYVKSCNNDINRIMEERNKAIKEANNAVEDFNNYVKSYWSQQKLILSYIFLWGLSYSTDMHVLIGIMTLMRC